MRFAVDRRQVRGTYFSGDRKRQSDGSGRARGYDLENLREQLFYCNQRGLTTEDAVGLIVNGYAREVLNKLPMEFAVEAQKLLAISLEGSVG